MTDTATGEDLPPQVLLDPAVLDEPYELYQRLREDAPVWRVPGTSIVTVASFEAVTQAAVRPADFSSNIRALLYRGDDGAPATMPFGGTDGDGDGIDVLATADPPIHTKHRSTVFPQLVARRMATLRDEITELADAHIGAALAAGSPVEFMDDVANAVPIRVVAKLIGFHDEDPDRLLDAAFTSTGLLAATEPLEQTMDKMVRTSEVMGWITDQLDRAQVDGTDGILGLIADAIMAGELDRGSGVVIMHTLLSAGGESTTGLLGNAAHILATRPDLQDQLRAESDLVVPFVEEVLRLEAPFRYHMRHAPHDTELCGTPVPAGSTVLLLWGAANRDPAEYDRPDEIELGRDAPRHHLGFGRGLHLCVGAPLARIEAEVVLRRFLARTTTFTLAPDRHPTRERSLVVRRFTSLPLSVETAA
jgi:cytochrome P450